MRLQESKWRFSQQPWNYWILYRTFGMQITKLRCDGDGRLGVLVTKPQTLQNVTKPLISQSRCFMYMCFVCSHLICILYSCTTISRMLPSRLQSRFIIPRSVERYRGFSWGDWTITSLELHLSLHFGTNIYDSKINMTKICYTFDMDR